MWQEFSSAIWYSYFNQDKREFPGRKHWTCTQFPVKSRLGPIKRIHTTGVTMKACLPTALWRSSEKRQECVCVCVWGGGVMRENSVRGSQNTGSEKCQKWWHFWKAMGHPELLWETIPWQSLIRLAVQRQSLPLEHRIRKSEFQLLLCQQLIVMTSICCQSWNTLWQLF